MAEMAVCIIDTSKKAFDFTEWNESDGGYEKIFVLFGESIQSNSLLITVKSPV